MTDSDQLKPQAIPDQGPDLEDMSPNDPKAISKPSFPPIKPPLEIPGSPPKTPLVDSSFTPKWDDTQKIIAEIEESLKAKLITIYISHGYRLVEETVDYVYNHIQTIGKIDKITLLIYGFGGSGVAATRIVYLLRKYCTELEVIVPSTAASALTMLALGANKILMGPLSSLSPIDSSIGNHPLAPKDPKGHPVGIEVTQLQKFIELLNSGMSSKTVDDINKSPYALLAQHVHPIVIGTIQRILSLSKMLTSDILKTHLADEERINYIVDQLNDAFPTHGYPITYDKTRDLRIQAELMTPQLNRRALNLIKLYEFISQGGSREKEGVKIMFKRPVILENLGMRSYYYQENKFTLGEKNNWIESGSEGNVIVVAPRTDEKGIMKVRPLQPDEILPAN